MEQINMVDGEKNRIKESWEKKFNDLKMQIQTEEENQTKFNKSD